MPMSYLEFNERPFGLAAITTANNEDVLLKVLDAWETTFPKRRPPPLGQPSDTAKWGCQVEKQSDRDKYK